MRACIALLALLTSIAGAQTLTISANPTAGQNVTFTCTVASGDTNATVFYTGNPPNQPAYVNAAAVAGTVQVAINYLAPGTWSAYCKSLPSGAVTASTGFTVAQDPLRSYVKAYALVDASGTPIANGTICFTPINALGNPTPFNAGGVANARGIAVCKPVVNGEAVGLLMLARSDKSIPVGVTYAIDLTDASTGQKQRLGIADVTDNTSVPGIFDLSVWAPSNVQTEPPAAWVVGPQGPAGVAPSGSGVHSETGSNAQATAITLPAGQPGTLPGDQIYRAGCHSTTGAVALPGSAYYALPLAPSGSTLLSLTSGIPPGVVYDYTTSGTANDPNYSQTATVIVPWLCNTTSSAITFTPGSITLTQFSN